MTLKGKNGLVVGIANSHSIAWGCARAFYQAGASLAVTYLNEKALPFVRPLAEQLDAPLILPLDVRDDAQLEAVFGAIDQKWGKLDFLLHAIAYAPKSDIEGELSHQDTTLAEAWMSEPLDRARVLFPPDANAAMACIEACYRTQGQIWAVVVPKRPVPNRLDRLRAQKLITDGVLRIVGSGAADERLVLVAIGAYQLNEVLRASRRLTAHNVAHAVVIALEPGRLRSPRDDMEALTTLSDAVLTELFPDHSTARVVVSHTRPEPLAGVLRRLDTGRDLTWYLGFINRGGTLDTFGMLFANRCTWAHALATAAQAMGVPATTWLTEPELACVQGRGDPQVLR